MNDKFFWPSVGYTLQNTNLWLEFWGCGVEKKMPEMGFINGAIDTKKKKLQENWAENKDPKGRFKISLMKSGNTNCIIIFMHQNIS